MTWTTDRPQQIGWYWWRSKRFNSTSMAFWDGEKIDFMVQRQRLSPQEVHPNIEFAGPIPEPSAPEEG